MHSLLPLREPAGDSNQSVTACMAMGTLQDIGDSGTSFIRIFRDPGTLSLGPDRGPRDPGTQDIARGPRGPHYNARGPRDRGRTQGTSLHC